MIFVTHTHSPYLVTPQQWKQAAE